MSAAKSLKTYYHKFLGLGWARVFLVIGVVFLLLTIVEPLWSITDGLVGGDYSTTTFGWTSWTATEYHSGVWSRTITESYTAPGSDLSALANAIGASYLLIVVFLIVLVAYFALFSSGFALHLHGLSLLIVGLIAVIIGLVALFYPVAAVAPAAATASDFAGVTGFWGASGTVSWGAGLGWWLLLLGFVFGALGAIWPFLKTMRQPLPPPPPRQYQIEP